LSSKTSFLETLGNLSYFIITAYIFIVLIRILISWVNPSGQTPLMRFLYKSTNPALNFTRKICPFVMGGLDFSPVLLLLSLNLLAFFFRASLIYIGRGFSLLVAFPILAQALLSLVQTLNWILIILMVARVIISQVNPSPYNPLVMVVYGLTEPLLAPLRRWFPKGPKGLDIKALIFIAGLMIFNVVVIDTFMKISQEWIFSYRPQLFI
jgi:YggT family protein